jgi:hypothetical protein
VFADCSACLSRLHLIVFLDDSSITPPVLVEGLSHLAPSLRSLRLEYTGLSAALLVRLQTQLTQLQHLAISSKLLLDCDKAYRERDRDWLCARLKTAVRPTNEAKRAVRRQLHTGTGRPQPHPCTVCSSDASSPSSSSITITTGPAVPTPSSSSPIFASSSSALLHLELDDLVYTHADFQLLFSVLPSLQSLRLGPGSTFSLTWLLLQSAAGSSNAAVSASSLQLSPAFAHSLRRLHVECERFDQPAQQMLLYLARLFPHLQSIAVTTAPHPPPHPLRCAPPSPADEAATRSAFTALLQQQMAPRPAATLSFHLFDHYLHRTWNPVRQGYRLTELHQYLKEQGAEQEEEEGEDDG